MDNESPKRPVIITGFRPRRSDRRLQCRTVIACVAKKRECYSECCETAISAVVDMHAYHETNIIPNFRFVTASNPNITDEL